MPSQLSSESTKPGARGSGWLLPAGTFLVGCALGAVVMGVGDIGSEDPSATVAATTTDAQVSGEGDRAAGEGSSDGGDASLYVRVPDSCLQTADDATTLVEQVDRMVAAVADLEPERLRQTVDDVQQIRDEVQDVAEQCRAAAAQRLQDAAADEAAPATPAS